ncbi:hypothetical protein N7463_000254 [Penicillium fimorum]|uniref:NmrA-like domain-containing protein n=1 Tax=Penicillium fimorum TaxID=1882269 RepID=A0A9W9Y453_9EURO|nr:hypothetical protein N7463_000254 [Penicillium fimorum]
MSHCEANLDEDQCADPHHPIRPALYFLIWSIVNLNNWMVSLLTAVDHTAGVAQGLAATLVDTFATNMENIPLVNAGPAMAAGFLGGLAAIFPPAAVAGGFGSSLATIGGGLLSITGNKKPVELEPKFNDFTDITAYIAKASEGMQNSIETYTQWLLTEIPSNDRSNGVYYVNDPKSLPNILLNGDFAEPRTSDILPDGIYVSLFSAAIAILWKQELATVVKITHEVPLSKLVCEDENAFKGNKWCDGEGNAYFLFRWEHLWNDTPWQGGLADEFRNLKGVDKLGDYRLSIETVVTASEYAASLNRGQPFYEWDTTKVIDHMNQDEQNMARFSGFNLPFCQIEDGIPLVAPDKCDNECQTLWAVRRCFGSMSMVDIGYDEIFFQQELAQKLAKIPGVEVIEQNWVEITSDWLREHQVTRAFIAPHNEPNHFAEESTFHVAALNAGVKYVVRISTTAANVRPDCNAYYPRAHWAIEALLSSPEFTNLQWTSLQPNIFTPLYLAGAVEFIKQYRKTGEHGTLKLMASKDAPVGVIDPYEVGVFAASLLSHEDPTVHNKAKYVLNGPEDITGKELVDLIEQHIGTQVEDVSYQDMSLLDMLYEHTYAPTHQSKNVIYSIRHALETAWDGKCTASTTSKAVLELAPPKITPAEALKSLLEE